MPAPGEERSSDDPAEGSTDAGTTTGPDPDPDPDPGRGRGRPGDVPGPGVDPEPPQTREEWRSDDGSAGKPPAETGDEEPPGWWLYAYDFATSAFAVAVIGACLFAVSGVWPPLVAVESTSMVPNMQVNDLVFVMEADRFAGPGAHEETGVVTAHTGRAVEYRAFGGYGDVIVYQRDGNPGQVPIIHRAMFWVEAGENWYDRADPAHITAEACGETPSEGLKNCPAPHAGFITKGDSNGRYDQVTSLSRPVRPEWVIGTAEVRVPGLGWIRLRSAAANGTGAPTRRGVPAVPPRADAAGSHS